MDHDTTAAGPRFFTWIWRAGITMLLATLLFATHPEIATSNVLDFGSLGLILAIAGLIAAGVTGSALWLLDEWERYQASA